MPPLVQLLGNPDQEGIGKHRAGCDRYGHPPSSAISREPADIHRGDQARYFLAIHDARQQLAGRGYASNSPLLAALNQQAQGQGLQAKTAAEQQTRQNMAQLNAQQVLQSQQAREAQYAARQQEYLQGQQIAATRQNALLAALAGMV